MDQREAPIVEALDAYLSGGFVPFVIPAHKQGRRLDKDTLGAVGADAYRHDVGMLNGLDDMRESHELQVRAQELAADLMGAKQSFYLVNGSTLSVQCAITAVARPGEKLIVGRNGHKSVFSGLIVGGVEPVFVAPAFDDEYDVTHAVEAADVAAALERHPDAKGVVVVSPTYYGVAADLRAIAEVAHAHGVPVIADDAWGALYPFHPELPAAALESGCDVAIGSFHKSLTGLQQASILSVQGDLVDPTIIEYRIGLVETSSISSLILASMDAARRLMALRGEEEIARTLELAHRARVEIDALPGLNVLGGDWPGRRGVHGLDETKVSIDVSGLGTNGYEACDWLRAERRVLMELADHRRVLATVTLGDDDESIGQLIEAMRALSARDGGGEPAPPMPNPSQLQTELVTRPRDAYFAEGEHIPLERAIGRIAAEKVTPYPPGIPVLVPGERITEPIVDYLRAGVAIGMNITDVADSKLETVRVVA